MKTIIFDFNRTIYDPDSKRLIYGARRILELALTKGYILYLISQRENGREEILVRKDLGRYFQKKYFVDKKDASLFRDILADNRLGLDEVIVIGDNLQSEIRAGYRCGLKTVWIRKGKFSKQRKLGIKPDIAITDIRQIAQII